MRNAVVVTATVLRFTTLYALVLWVAAATAQPYPSKPITLLHAYSAGSGCAVLLRTLAESAGKFLPQTVMQH